MHTRSLRRRVRITTLVMSVAGASAIFVAGGSIAAAKPKHHHHKHHHKHKSSLAGTWSGSYSGTYSGTFTLHWTQSGKNLTGSIALSAPHGTYSCTGKVHNGKITFGSVGAGATYKGSVSGKSMSGTYKTKKGGGTWSATKTS